MRNIAIISFLSIVILLLVAVTMYQYFSYRQNLTKIRNITQKLTEIFNSDSDEKVMVFTDDKIIIDLAEQINRLLDDRQRIKAEYRHSEISSKKMLSNISHDIKTPLTVILGYLEIMLLNAAQTENTETLKKVEHKANQVMDLINQFFTLAKLEAGDQNIEISKINLNEICRENILDFYDILTEKNIQVDVSIPEKNVFVFGNKDALHRILFNLLSNAVRYGSDGKYLGITLRSDHSSAYIDVIDKGKGIDKDFAASVFERLYTMEDSRNREIQGNGLGLTIAKNLAIQLGGDICVESDPFVKTVFSVKLRQFIY